jgi:hypothetical protein
LSYACLVSPLALALNADRSGLVSVLALARPSFAPGVCSPTEKFGRVVPARLLLLGAGPLYYTGFSDAAYLPGPDPDTAAVVMVRAGEPAEASRGADTRTPTVELAGGSDGGAGTNRVSLDVPTGWDGWSAGLKWDDPGDLLLSPNGVGRLPTSAPPAAAPPPAAAGAAAGVVVTATLPVAPPSSPADARTAEATAGQPALITAPSPGPTAGTTHSVAAVAGPSQAALGPAPTAKAGAGGQQAEEFANGRSYSVHHDTTLSVAPVSGILSAYDYDLTGSPPRSPRTPARPSGR